MNPFKTLGALLIPVVAVTTLATSAFAAPAKPQTKPVAAAAQLKAPTKASKPVLKSAKAKATSAKRALKSPTKGKALRAKAVKKTAGAAKPTQTKR